MPGHASDQHSGKQSRGFHLSTSSIESTKGQSLVSILAGVRNAGLEPRAPCAGHGAKRRAWRTEQDGSQPLVSPQGSADQTRPHTRPLWTGPNAHRGVSNHQSWTSAPRETSQTRQRPSAIEARTRTRVSCEDVGRVEVAGRTGRSTQGLDRLPREARLTSSSRVSGGTAPCGIHLAPTLGIIAGVFQTVRAQLLGRGAYWPGLWAA